MCTQRPIEPKKAEAGAAVTPVASPTIEPLVLASPGEPSVEAEVVASLVAGPTASGPPAASSPEVVEGGASASLALDESGPPGGPDDAVDDEPQPVRAVQATPCSTSARAAVRSAFASPAVVLRSRMGLRMSVADGSPFWRTLPATLGRNEHHRSSSK